MKRGRRSTSKEDILIDSGISLSSPPAITRQSLDDKSHETAEHIINKNDNAKQRKTKEYLTKKNKKKLFELNNEAKTTRRLQKLNVQKSKNIEYENLDKNDDLCKTTAEKRRRKTYKCCVCQKVFGGKTDLQRHELIHSNERPYKCPQCEKCYRQAVNLKNHITTAHEHQKNFQCDQCSQRFALKERLRLHMRLHSGEKPYACTLCNKRFPRGGQLQQHIASHHKERTKKHICTKCSTAFSTVSNLRAHMLHHEEGREYHCEICNENFLNEVWLRAHIKKVHYKMRPLDCDICKLTIHDGDFVEHMKTHSHLKTYECDVCNAYFTQKSQYNVHMRMHTGERPYQCRICWQTFAHSSVLKLHIRKHTGEKPFKCVLCTDEVAFSQLAHLKTHMKKIHKQENTYMCKGCQTFFKTKTTLLAHMDDCQSYKQRLVVEPTEAEQANNATTETNTLSHLRFLIAIMLKKISSEEKLQQLGFEKRLIDNVMIASLKLANRKAYDDNKFTDIQRLRLNITEFLNWIVPAPVMSKFYKENMSVDNILENIVTMYMKQK